MAAERPGARQRSQEAPGRALQREGAGIGCRPTWQPPLQKEEPPSTSAPSILNCQKPRRVTGTLGRSDTTCELVVGWVGVQ
jgi:hypothetical protein